MKVAKFGGTSMADAEQIKKVCSIILSDTERTLIVVSAPGKRHANDVKVTDLLIALAGKAASGGAWESELNAVVSRYAAIADGLKLGGGIITEIENDLKGRLAKYAGHEEKLTDAVKAAGEDNTAKVVAGYLKSLGHEVCYVDPKDIGMLLSDDYGNAQVLPESYDNLARLKQIPGIKVFPGFFGYTRAGDVVTFPRGGSDITGSILAAAVGADVYENFTDVDSVFSANPGIVNKPEAITALTYREMRELSYAGFTVLHEETLLPVFKAGIPVNIRNTNNPGATGTMITITRHPDPDRPVVGVAGKKGFCFIDISKYLMNREVGFGRKVLQILEDAGLSYEHTPSGIDNISVILNGSKLTQEIEQKVISRIRKELSVDLVEVHRGFSIIFIVGEGMRNSVGLAARATQAIASADVNIEMINQGASEISMMFGVQDPDMDKSVQAIYSEFFRS
ncbi:MAG: aspartate kinase [Spirochaetales bacterium]|nr:aspartate kinase [Spirochaetales bacterium]